MKNEIGHYIVDSKIFDNKFDAVSYAQNRNSRLQWYFHDKIFNSIDWFTEPELSIKDLYRIRAIQIREKYDYIIVFCSGGADSTNVIRTFLDNGIHVDEVIAIAPLGGLSNWTFNNQDTSEYNTISEIKYAMMPLLKEISERRSSIKITINDYFDELVTHNTDEWIYSGCGNIVTTLTSQFTNIEKFDHISKLIQSGKKIGLIYGTDKPIIKLFDNGDLNIVFADSGINYLTMPSNRKYPNVDRVLFYWTPDLPQLLIKQAHIVANAAKLPGNKVLLDTLMAKDQNYNLSFQDFNTELIKNNIDPVSKETILNNLLNTNPKNLPVTPSYKRKTLYQRLIVPYIYPDTIDYHTFQCFKVNVDQGFFTKDQSWIKLIHGKSRINEIINTGIRNLYNSISPKYLNQFGTGYQIHFKIYKFGNISNV